MLNTGLFLMLFSSPVQAEEMDDLKRDIKALELFLQDQDDYELYCSHLILNGTNQQLKFIKRNSLRNLVKLA
jgi:hypothetical protein